MARGRPAKWRLQEHANGSRSSRRRGSTHPVGGVGVPFVSTAACRSIASPLMYSAASRTAPPSRSVAANVNVNIDWIGHERSRELFARYTGSARYKNSARSNSPTNGAGRGGAGDKNVTGLCRADCRQVGVRSPSQCRLLMPVQLALRPTLSHLAPPPLHFVLAPYFYCFRLVYGSEGGPARPALSARSVFLFLWRPHMTGRPAYRVVFVFR